MPSRFWITQPVGRKAIGQEPNNIITSNVPIALPPSYYWSTVEDIPMITNFLGEYYVEDVTSNYSLSYSVDFFEFLFEHPNHKKEYSLGLFYQHQLVGYILAREHRLVIKEVPYFVVSINFLCISKEIRSQNFAPLMIKEMTRIANKNRIFYAIFTAEKDHGFSISKARYYHYLMNGKNLLKAQIIDSIEEVPALPEKRNGTVQLFEPDKIFHLYERMRKNFSLHELFLENQFEQVFSGRDGVFYTLYNELEQEFVSFFIVETKCTKLNTSIKRAYLYYWHGTARIIDDAIAFASKVGVDMFDVLNIAQNTKIIRELHFKEGSGVLKYHLFNLNNETVELQCLNFILF